MKRLVTGIRDGKSCVVREDAIDFPGGGPKSSRWFELGPNRPTMPPGAGEVLDLHVPPGEIACVSVRLPPNGGWPQMHRTRSIDVHTIVSGSVELVLDDGNHRLGPGDCVVVAGVDHAWLTGDEGCVTSVVILGTA